jgi:hypothetical protein
MAGGLVSAGGKKRDEVMAARKGTVNYTVRPIFVPVKECSQNGLYCCDSGKGLLPGQQKVLEGCWWGNRGAVVSMQRKQNQESQGR